VTSTTTADAAHPGAESPLRWWVLALAAIAVSSSYYESDVIGSVADLLERQRGFSQSQIAMLNSALYLPNVVLAVFSGMLIDRFGAARIALWAAAIGVAGAAMTAVGEPYELMVAGRFLYGICEGAIFIALVAGLAQWFPPTGIALATSLYLSLARVGSYAENSSSTWARPVYEQGWAGPLWLGAGISVAGFIAALMYLWIDRRRPVGNVRVLGALPEPIVWSELLRFDMSYWYILGLHVLYAAVFFPFRQTFAVEYFQHAKGLTLQQAGVTNSWVFLAAIFVTPCFGLLADRYGHRALMLVFGTLLLPLSFVVLGATDLSLWVTTVMIGISWSLVPAVIWPSTTLIVEPKRLGTALGLITLVQAAGIALSNAITGWLANRAGAGADNPAGYTVMLWFFFLLSLVALTSALLLWRREAGPNGHGLEDANKLTRGAAAH